MAKEIERKFLVDSNKWAMRLIVDRNKRVRDEVLEFITQGYIAKNELSTTRVRHIVYVDYNGDNVTSKGFLCVKSKTVGISRDEFEYEIPADDADQMLKELCTLKLRKMRAKVKVGKLVWEVDTFFDQNLGLQIAEVELENEEQEIEKPEWVGEEVSFDRRYSGSALGATPYQTWGV